MGKRRRPGAGKQTAPEDRARPRSPRYRSDGWLLLIVFAMAFAARALYFSSVQNLPLFGNLFLDSQYYVKVAELIQGGHGAGDHPYLMSPLYPYFVSLFIGGDGVNVHAIQWVQALMNSVTACLVMAVTYSISGRVVALIAGILAGIYGPLVYSDGTVMVESLQTFLIVSILGLLVFENRLADNRQRLVWMVSKRRMKGICWAGAGVLIGVLSALRPTGIVVAAAICVVYWLRSYRGRRAANWWTRPLIRSILFVLFMFAVILPFTVRNYRASGEAILLSAHGGLNFWLGNNREATGLYKAPPGYSFRDDPAGYHLARTKSGEDLSYAEASRWWVDRAVRDIRSNPWGFVKLLCRKCLYLFHPGEISSMGGGYTWFREQSWVLRLPVDARVLFLLALFAPLFALWYGGRSYLAALVWHVTILSSYCSTLVLFLVHGRYRTPIMPIVVILSSVSIVGFWKLVTAPGERGHLKGVGVFVGAAALFLGSHLLYDTESAPLRVQGKRIGERRHVAMALSDQGRYEEAAAVYREILNEFDDATTRMNLANALKRLGRIHQAKEEYERALEVKPEDGTVWYNYGNLYMNELQDPANARAAYENAVKYNPGLPEAHFNLGIVNLRLRDSEAALKAFRELLLVAPPASPLAERATGLIQVISGDSQ